MKAVYIHKIYLHLKINGIWKYADRAGVRYVYLYGEVPENRVEEFKNKDTVFSELIKRSGYIEGFTGHKTFWRKRVYLNLFPLATFDMSLVVASGSPISYLKIRKFDLFFKLMFLIICLLGVFSMAGMYVASKCLGF